jgi:hypothetical protein
MTTPRIPPTCPDCLRLTGAHMADSVDHPDLCYAAVARDADMRVECLELTVARLKAEPVFAGRHWTMDYPRSLRDKIATELHVHRGLHPDVVVGRANELLKALGYPPVKS